MKTKFILPLLLSSVLLQPSSFGQGSLTPLAAPAPTMKSLDQIEARTPISSLPFSITASGSYYLTSSMSFAFGSGITISADDVTVDLNGFAITGVAGSGAGVFVSGIRRNILVKNGTIRDCGTQGVSLANALNSEARHLLIYNNTSTGIITGAYCRVDGCVVNDNGTIGISTGAGSLTANCTVTANAGIGIQVNNGSAVLDCVVADNGGIGIDAYNGNSISCATVKNCTSYSNNGGGIFVGVGSVVTHCAVTETGPGNAGIICGPGAQIIDSVVRLAGGVGIDVGTLGTVSNCTVAFSTTDGIRVITDARITNNHSVANGNGGDGAGIHATNSDNHIEGNIVTDNDRGIDIDAGGNFVVKNTATSNSTNYDVAVGNVGLYVSASTNAVAVNGPSGGAALGSTDPWVNFSY